MTTTPVANATTQNPQITEAPRRRIRARDAAVTSVAEGVIVPQTQLNNVRDQGLATSYPLPWTFERLDLSSLPGGRGTVLYVQNHTATVEGSMKATFASDPELIAFQTKHRITFHLNLSKEAPINLPPEVCRAAGIPEIATAFQFIYPAALSVTFNIPNEDTPAARTALVKAIKEELRPYMQHLLLIGGYIYHCGDWQQEHGEAYRLLAGINVLDPNYDMTGDRPQLYFGQAKIVPESMHPGLRNWSEMTERFYSNAKRSGDYEAMCKITVGPLRDKGLTHFKWLEPKHELIAQMQTKLKDPNFGQFGVFVYYAMGNPQLSCMLPISTKDEWKGSLRNSSYLKVDQPDAVEDLEAFLSDQCIIRCGSTCEQTAEKLVRLLPCKHMQVCPPCLEQWRTRNNACPTCSTPIQSVDKPNALAALSYRPHLELGTFNLHLAPFASDDFEGAALLSSIVKKPVFRSPILPVSAQLKSRLGLPDTVTKYAFNYPIFGKSSDLTFSYIEGVKKEIEKGGDQAILLQGLVASGGFSFFSANNTLMSVYAIVGEGQLDQAVPLPLKAEDMPQDQDPISPELTKLKNIQEDTYNLCRITLQPLLPYAKYFQYDGANNRFVYSRGAKAAWQATFAL